MAAGAVVDGGRSWLQVIAGNCSSPSLSFSSLTLWANLLALFEPLAHVVSRFTRIEGSTEFINGVVHGVC